MSKKVITIHGINTDGSWQESINQILGPHFECSAIKYADYRWMGGTKILIDPIVLILGICAAVYFRRVPILLYGALAGSITLALFISYRRRGKTVERVKAHLDEIVKNDEAPHVIAHSFGTYIIGKIVAAFPDVRLDRLILTGCVLKRSTPWRAYLKANPGVVKQIRNEMAGKDFVARLAVMAYGLFPGLGDAGVGGFTDSSHTVEPNESCGIECTTLVHNVNLPGLDHRGVFIGGGHCRRFWLPFLWGLDPRDYEEFVGMCRLANKYENEGDSRLGIVEDELRNRHWLWADGHTLDEYLKMQITFFLTRKGESPLRHRIREIKDIAVGLMWHIVVSAHEVKATGGSSGDSNLQRCMYPRLAAMSAIFAASTRIGR